MQDAQSAAPALSRSAAVRETGAEVARHLVATLATALAFLFASRYASEFSESWGASFLFPPAGITLAASAAFGIWGVFGVVAGVLLAPWGAATTSAGMLTFVGVHALGAAIPAWALRRPAGATRARLTATLLWGVAAMNVVTAATGTLALLALGRLPLALDPLANNLFSWLIADAIACLVLGLPLLVWLRPAALLDAESEAQFRAWLRDLRRPGAALLLLAASAAGMKVVATLHWGLPGWLSVSLMAPVALAAFQGGLGAALTVNLPVALTYFGLVVLPGFGEPGSTLRAVLGPAYLALLFLAAFGIVGGFLAGNNRILLERVRTQQRELSRDFERTVVSLSAAIEAKDSTTVGHVQRVARLAHLLGARLGLEEAELASLRYGALLHDVGKIGVPESILNKPGPLDEREMRLMHRHVEIGLKILGSVSSLRRVLPLVQYHQERFDGATDGVTYPGYFGLRGEEIPLGARVLAVVDAFDAMTNDRPYREARSAADALAELRREAGRQFDPRVVDALAEVLDTFGWARLAARPVSDSGSLAAFDGSFAAGSDAGPARPKPSA